MGQVVLWKIQSEMPGLLSDSYNCTELKMQLDKSSVDHDN